jgi:hypothetical protein
MSSADGYSEIPWYSVYVLVSLAFQNQSTDSRTNTKREDIPRVGEWNAQNSSPFSFAGTPAQKGQS